MTRVGEVKQQLWSRLFRTTATEEFGPPVRFTLGSGTVAYHAHPALQELVWAHLRYQKDSETIANWNISVVISPTMWDLDCRNVRLEFVPCLDYGDGGVIVQTPGGRVIFSRATRSIIGVDYRERRIAVVAHDYPGAFLDSYKSVRHVLTSLALDRGASPLHASAVCSGGAAIAFVGSKGAGKSTSLLYALASRLPGLKYLANDRLLIECTNGGIRALAWPTVTGFGGGALSKLSGANAVLSPAYHLNQGGIAYMLLDLPLIERIGDRDSPDCKPNKVRLTPKELEGFFGVGAATDSALRCLVSISLDLQRKKSEVREIERTSDRAQLLRSHLETGFANHPDWLGLSPTSLEDRLVRSAEGLDQSLIENLPAFCVIGGQDLHDIVRGFCAWFRSNPMSLTPPPRWHFGVYGVVLDRGRLLTVRKTRGPYTNHLDLPGGSPNAGEDLDVALGRELAEETGGQIKLTGPWATFDIIVTRDSVGNPIQFRHAGHWRYVHLTGVKYDMETFEDVSGIEWLELTSTEGREDLSAPLREVVRALPRYCADAGIRYDS